MSGLIRAALTWATSAQAAARSAQRVAVDPAALAGLPERYYLEYRDEKAAGTAGGDFNNGAWQTRTLNTEKHDAGGFGALAANRITLQAGTYECWICCPANEVAEHQARLYNVTGAATLVVGTSNRASAGGATMNHSIIVGRFTLGVASALEVQHRCANTKVVNGFGYPTPGGWGEVEVYTVARFWKVA